METDYLIELQSIANYGMLGVIWLIQLSIYPGFGFIMPQRFRSFHAHHSLTLSTVLVPLMLIELVLAASLLVIGVPYGIGWQWLLFLLVLAVWLMSFFVQLPLHQKLSDGYDYEVISQLIRWNWVRTIACSLKSVLLFTLKVGFGS